MSAGKLSLHTTCSTIYQKILLNSRIACCILLNLALHLSMKSLFLPVKTGKQRRFRYENAKRIQGICHARQCH